MNNWPIYRGPGLAFAATNVSSRVQVVNTAADAAAEDVMIDNPGPVDVFVRAGDASVVATVLDLRVPAASMQPFGKGNATHVAFITAAGAQDGVVHLGAGE